MGFLFDRMIVSLSCLVLFAAVPADAHNIALLLAAFSASVGACALRERGQLALLAAYALASCLYAPLALFAAPAVCGLASSRLAWPRIAWLAVPALTFTRLPLEAWGLALALDALACLVGIRSGAVLAERKQYRLLRDKLREDGLALEESNRRLQRGLASAEARAAEPLASMPLALGNLTERELEIAALVARGLDNKEIAAKAYVSEGTVRNRISAILQKSGLDNRTQLAVAYLKHAASKQA